MGPVMGTIGRVVVVAMGYGLLTACTNYSKEESFLETYARHSCDFSKKCYYAYYLDEFSDRDDCIDETLEDLEDAADFYDDADCDYDEDAAKDCIAALKDARTCEENDIDDIGDACEDVYDCG